MQHIAVFRSAQGIRWRLNHIHSMKYAAVISASIAANSAGIDFLFYFYRAQLFSAKKILRHSYLEAKILGVWGTTI